MPKHKYSALVEEGVITSITWYTEDGNNHTVTNDHPKFLGIKGALDRGEPHEFIMSLFSNKRRVNEYFSKVGLYGVHYNGSTVLVQGQAVPSELSKLIIDHVNEDTDPTPLVRFFKNLNDNPSYQSKKELISFIVRHGLTITDDGHFIAYKGLRSDGKSVHSGLAYVDGVAVNGHIPNAEGSVITLPRGEVDDNRSIGCSTGLHAGTWKYASGFGHHGHTAQVKIHPADVVSVPSDHSEQKLRVCRYSVMKRKVPAPHSGLVWTDKKNTTTLWRDGESETVTGNATSSNSNVLWSA